MRHIVCSSCEGYQLSISEVSACPKYQMYFDVVSGEAKYNVDIDDEESLSVVLEEILYDLRERGRPAER